MRQYDVSIPIPITPMMKGNARATVTAIAAISFAMNARGHSLRARRAAIAETTKCFALARFALRCIATFLEYQLLGPNLIRLYQGEANSAMPQQLNARLRVLTDNKHLKIYNQIEETRK